MLRRQVNTVLNINSLYSYHKLLGLFFSRMWTKSYQPWHFRFYKYIYRKMSWEKNHEWYLFKDSADTLSMQSFLWISKSFREMIWTWKKMWWKGSIEMSRLAKIDLVTCGGFRQRDLCGKRTACVSGVHWNVFPGGEEWYEQPEQGTIAVFVLIAEVALSCNTHFFFSCILCRFSAQHFVTHIFVCICACM